MRRRNRLTNCGVLDKRTASVNLSLFKDVFEKYHAFSLNQLKYYLRNTMLISSIQNNHSFTIQVYSASHPPCDYTNHPGSST